MNRSTSSRLVVSLVLALSAALLTSACGGNDSPTGPPQTGTVEIQLQAQSFEPGDVLIEPGTTVRWVNAQSIQHTITPDGHDEWERAVVTEANEVFEHTFHDEGTFPYFCEPHQAVGMTGRIRVEGS